MNLNLFLTPEYQKSVLEAAPCLEHEGISIHSDIMYIAKRVQQAFGYLEFNTAAYCLCRKAHANVPPNAPIFEQRVQVLNSIKIDGMTSLFPENIFYYTKRSFCPFKMNTRSEMVEHDREDDFNALKKTFEDLIVCLVPHNESMNPNGILESYQRGACNRPPYSKTDKTPAKSPHN